MKDLRMTAMQCLFFRGTTAQDTENAGLRSARDDRLGLSATMEDVFWEGDVAPRTNCRDLIWTLVELATMFGNEPIPNETCNQLLECYLGDETLDRDTRQKAVELLGRCGGVAGKIAGVGVVKFLRNREIGK